MHLFRKMNCVIHVGIDVPQATHRVLEWNGHFFFTRIAYKCIFVVLIDLSSNDLIIVLYVYHFISLCFCKYCICLLFVCLFVVCLFVCWLVGWLVGRSVGRSVGWCGVSLPTTLLASSLTIFFYQNGPSSWTASNKRITLPRSHNVLRWNHVLKLSIISHYSSENSTLISFEELCDWF